MFEHNDVKLIHSEYNKRYEVQVEGKKIYQSAFDSHPYYCDAYRRYRKEAYNEGA